LASIGLYGLLSYSVNQRQREISIRMALGAGRAQVVRLILGQGMVMVSIGIAIGIALSLVSARALSNALYGVGAADIVSFLGASSMLVLTASLASYLPARVASKVNPMAGLRSA
jgi:putative ABC transport system permease protein